MKSSILTPGLFLTSILSSCYRDPVQEEIHLYLHEKIAEISHLEKSAISSFESVTGGNYSTDQEIYNTLIYDVIPVYYEFLTKLRLIEVNSPVLQNIHVSCVNGVKLQYNAFINIAAALEELDKGKMAEANAMLVDACKLNACPLVY